MALLKFLLLLGLGVSVNSDVSLQKRIIGGHDCGDKERLYHVRITANDLFVCGGSLLTAEWILTAAHCWLGDKGRTMGAQLGVHPRTAKREDQIIEQGPVIYTDDKGQKHDIMLVKLKTSAKDFPAVKLPDCTNRPKKVQLAGFASTDVDENNVRVYEANPITLQCVDMNVVDCPKNYQKHYKNDHIFCVKETKKDTCRGDSGGGAVFNGMIYGVISGSGKDYACLRPAIMMDVCEYMEWIKQTTGLK